MYYERTCQCNYHIRYDALDHVDDDGRGGRRPMVDWKFLEELTKEPDTDSLRSPWHAGRPGCLSVLEEDAIKVIFRTVSAEVVDKLAKALEVNHRVIDDMGNFPMRTAIDLITGEEVTTYNGKDMQRMLRPYSQNFG